MTITGLLIEFSLKSKLLTDPKKLDALLEETLPKIVSATRYTGQLLTEKDVASLYPRLFDVIKLRNLRARGGGPAFIKFGSARNARVYYRIRSIEQWIREHEETSVPFEESFRQCA